VRTLPVLLALDGEGPDSELARLLGDPMEVEAVLEILRNHPALELARDAARLEAAKAKRALRALTPDGDRATALEGLAYLADYAANRPG
jgi:geranylgeranyl pyrophosphate synthase